jgi:hypothetical protein
MATITQRLNRLESTLRKLGAGVCQLCHGNPFVAIHIMYEATGSGFRPTGVRYLARDGDRRVTDDLRCRQCGAEARQTHLMTLVGVGPEPGGRRVCV